MLQSEAVELEVGALALQPCAVAGGDNGWLCRPRTARPASSVFGCPTASRPFTGRKPLEDPPEVLFDLLEERARLSSHALIRLIQTLALQLVTERSHLGVLLQVELARVDGLIVEVEENPGR